MQCLVHCGFPGAISCQKSRVTPSTRSPSLGLSGAFLGNRSFQWFIIAPFLNSASTLLVLQIVRTISKVLASAECRRHTLLAAFMVNVSLSYLGELHEQSEDRSAGHFGAGGYLTQSGPAGVFCGADPMRLAQLVPCFSRGRTPLDFIFNDF